MGAHDGDAQGLSSGFPAMQFDCWEKFKGFISADLLARDNPQGDPLPVWPRYLFRGQGDEAWHLEPAFDRTFISLPDHERAAKHKLLLTNFKHECRHFPDYRDDIEDDMRCLALAQHFGLPTRLLDWTESPYIAAYFAFRAHLSIDRGTGVSGKNKRVAIWILDRNFDQYWGGFRGVQVIDLTSWCNERLKRQFGWFTLAQTPCSNLEEYVLQLGNKQGALRKITLSAGMAEPAMRDLEYMRISARELFADLTGAATNALVRSVLG